MLQPISLGWHPVEPGPSPRSLLRDDPPAPTGTDDVQSYQLWRARVLADEQQLAANHQLSPIWFPVQLLREVNVLPIFGGTPQAIEQAVTTLVTSALQSRVTSRVVNLSGWGLNGSLRQQMSTARSSRARFEVISPRGSSVNLFGNPRPSELIALLVDALRVSADRGSARSTQQQRQELERVAKMLRPPVTLDRIIDAVDLALGATSPAPTLTVDEVRDLRDYFASVVSQRRATQDRLSDLHVDLAALAQFRRTRKGLALGGGPATTVRWYDVEPGSSGDELELGRQLAARAVLQAFGLAAGEELLVVAGAERLSDDVLSGMTDTALRLGKRVAVVFTQFSDAGKRLLGYAGSSVALFLRMPNPADATAASEFLGREFKFVVNGISIAEGQTQEWSRSFGSSTSVGTSRSSSVGSSSGMSGLAFNFSRSVGSSVSRSFERSSSTTSTVGGSRSTTNTTSTGRVHEYVLEPEVFQQMPDDVMMVVADGAVTVASCDSTLRFARRTSRNQVMTLP